jgi:hypothetical protein
VRDILIIVLLRSRFREFKIADDPLKSQRDDKWVGKVLSVILDSNRVGGVSGVGCHKLGAFINHHTIHSALHGAE